VAYSANTKRLQLSRTGVSYQLALLVGSFAIATVIAKAFGAGWGTASGVGQIAFAAVLVAVLLRAD
jgi:hypothetical protein